MTTTGTVNEAVRIAIPATGRMAQECLEWLVDKGALEEQWTKAAVAALDEVKKVDDEEPVVQEVAKLWSQGMRGMTAKYDLRSGWRTALSATNGLLAGTSVTIYGSEPPTITGIRQGLADAAILGFDDLLAAMVPYLRVGNKPEMWQTPFGWGELNGRILPTSTDVRVLRPTGIDDYAGLFLLASQAQSAQVTGLIKQIRKGYVPLYVKGRNQGLAYYLFGEFVDARPTEEIEEAVKSEKAFGLDIVRSGSTVLKNNLMLVGPCLLYTTPMITVDGWKLQNKPSVGAVMFSLTKGENGTDAHYIRRVYDWEQGLCSRLGSQWAHREDRDFFAKTI